MKAGRRSAGRYNEAPHSPADLFPRVEHSSVVPTLTTVRGPGGVPPSPQISARPNSKHLWHAVVFPELNDTQAPAMLQRLSRRAQQFTSLVSIEMPNALLLELKGSVKLFGSLEVLLAQIDAVWKELSLPASSATAPTTLAALWCARAGHSLRMEDASLLAGGLAELPIGCTAWHADWLQTLRSMGVTRIGELLRLPRAGLARRLSPAAILDLDIATARQAAPRRSFVPRERFKERCDFETEVETVVYLEKAFEPLIERCARFLRERQSGIQALELKLRHRILPATRVRLGLASITSERKRLADVLTHKLGRIELVAPVRGIELLSGWLQPLSASSVDAFAGLRGGGRDTAPQLVERLRARLGEAAVYSLCSVPEHRPEAAWQRVHQLSLGGATRTVIAGRETPAEVRDDVMPRPVWLLDQPVLLTAEDLQQLHQGGLILEQGPERIESGWWDGKGVARDYYVARRLQGARWWIFQDRQTQSWYMHGVFA